MSIHEDFAFEHARIVLPGYKYPLGHFYAYICPDNTKISLTKAGLKCIIWELEILGPRNNGVVVRKWSMLQGAGISYTKGDFLNLGYRVSNNHDCLRGMRKLRNAVINIKIEDVDRENYNVLFLSKCKPDEIDMGPQEYYRNIFWK